jgi:beta-galactosidase
MPTRRQFLGKTVTATAALAATPVAGLPPDPPQVSQSTTTIVSLCGTWKFQVDAAAVGTMGLRQASEPPMGGAWLDVDVPHTWQVDGIHTDYRGVAWYRREFDAPEAWRNSAVRIEFEAVFHTATVWVNGQKAGEHLRKGYTAFEFDITPLLRWDRSNTIAVRVDNAFNEHMLPRGPSSDWANDGGIFRPVQLLVTPKTFIDRLHVDAAPDLSNGDAALTVTAHCRNAGTAPWAGTLAFRVIDEGTGRVVLTHADPAKLTLKAGADQTVTANVRFSDAKRWHFDSPHLYRLEAALDNGEEGHHVEATFGVRRFEVKGGAFHLNGEQVRLMGVERMAGSHPNFGMAEPAEWIEHDHRDLQQLNCVFTRVHWPQDRRVLDYCDRHGILMQSEVPTWGSDTFQGMGTEPDDDIMANGLEQLREMIARDRNHPSVAVWGLCNEIGGQMPAAYRFAERMLHEAKALDPSRLCTYASNSLDHSPERDVARLMDFIEANEYIGSWAPGTARDVGPFLDSLHAAFPGKPLVISEYGYCACMPDRPEGDGHRIDVLQSHTAAYRTRDFVGGAIFFCYNDYRTHVGDRGVGVLKQRVHGVVDVYGRAKPSYEVLRRESSAVESLIVENHENAFQLRLKARNVMPAHTLRGYVLSSVLYGQGDIPVEQRDVNIPDVAPGATVEVTVRFTQPGVPVRVQFDVRRPTRISTYTLNWMP